MRTVLAALFCVAASAAQAGTLYFTLQGTNPNGKSGYRGTVALTEVADGANGEKAGVVTWQVGQSAPTRGVALITRDSPERISIAFPNPNVPGVALGSLMPDGSVSLQWYVGGEAAGKEIWTPRR